MFCPNCGSNVPDTERFCPTCGTAMGGGNPAPAAPQAPAAKPDVVALIKSKLPLIIGAVVAVVAVVFLWSLLFGGSAAAKYVKASIHGDIKKADKYTFTKTEDYFEAAADDADMKIDDYYKSLDAKDFKDYCENEKEDADDRMSDSYGSNWKVKTKELGSTTDLSKEEEKEIEATLERYEELDLIEEADDYDNYKKVWVLVSTKGEDGKSFGVRTIYMAKKGLSWKVID